MARDHGRQREAPGRNIVVEKRGRSRRGVTAFCTLGWEVRAAQTGSILGVTLWRWARERCTWEGQSALSLEDRPQKFPEGEAIASINCRLIFILSFCALGMAVGTVSAIPSNVEPVIWLAIFVICAFVIARYRSRRHFLHGLLLGLVSSVWATSAHIT